MESFDRTFSKVRAGRGREALVAPAGAKLSWRPFFGSFFGLLLQRKTGDGLLNVSHNPLPKGNYPDPALAPTPRFLHLSLCHTSRCAPCTKTPVKTYTLWRDSHLTNGHNSGRIFKVARATVLRRKLRKSIGKSQKFSKKLLKNLLTNGKRCDIIIKLSRKTAVSCQKAADIGP